MSFVRYRHYLSADGALRITRNGKVEFVDDDGIAHDMSEIVNAVTVSHHAGEPATLTLQISSFGVVPLAPPE